MPYTLASTQNAPNVVHNTIAAPSSTEVAVLAVAGFDPTSATAGEFIDLFRSTGGATPTAQTPEKTNTNAAASAVTANRGSSTDPTKSGNSLVVLGYAHIVTTLMIAPREWRCPDPRYPVIVPVSGQISVQIDASGNVCDRYTVFAEPQARHDGRTRGRRGRTRGAWQHQDLARGANALTTRPAMAQLAGEFRFLQHDDWDAPARQVLAGILASLAGGGTLFTANLDGTLTDAGALTLQGNKALAGTLTDSGALARLALKALAGALTDAGALAKQAQKPLAGGVTPTGALTTSKLASVALSGALTFLGALARRANKAAAGTQATTGALTKQANKATVGTLTDSGALTKRANKPLVGTLAEGGTLANVKVAVQTLVGSLPLAGALTRRANKATTGALTPSGAPTQRANKPLAGGLATAGALARRANRALAGALAAAGALTPAGVAGGVVQAVIRARMAAGAGVHAAATGLATARASPVGLAGARVARATIAGARAVARGIAGLRIRSGGGG